jgi:hypothetical protein
MEQLKTFIAKHHASLDAHTELELRRGTFSGKFFNASITLDEFNRIKDLLHNPIITKINDTNFYKFPYRQRKIKTEKHSVWIKKEKIDQLDLPSLGIRIVIATEVTKTFNELLSEFNIRNPKGFFSPNKVYLLRKKTRYSEIHGAWRSDLTMVENYKFIDGRWKLMDTIYEYELEMMNSNNFINQLETLLPTMFRENYYYQLTNNTKFIGNQPKTLERKDLIKLTQTGYTLTDKVDGDRMFLMISDSVQLINKKLECIDIPGVMGPRGTILDGEYISKTKQFLAFDILYYSGECVMAHGLETRHFYLDKALSLINSDLITAKTFYYSEPPMHDISFVIYSDNIFKESLKMWDGRVEGSLDGLIYTPLHEHYKYSTNTYKWKDSITIDVMVHNKQFYSRDRSKTVCVADHIVFEHGFTFSEEIPNGEIAEFEFKDGSWKLLRLRKDKKVPNAILTIKSALLAIKQNITIQDISEINGDNTGMQYNAPGKTKIRRNEDADIGYRKFHNLVKNELVAYKKTGSFLLDLGAGKGGDLMKWEQAGYTHVLAIDSSWQHIYGPNGFHERYQKIKDKLNVKITIIWGDVLKPIRNGEAGLNKEETKKLKVFFKEHVSLKFDKITCNFAVHYFMKNLELWTDYMRNVRLLLKKGGLFVGTYLDGNIISQGEYFKDGKLIYTLKCKEDSEIKYTTIEEYWKNVPEISVKTLQWDHFIDEPVIFPELLEQLMSGMKFKKDRDIQETFLEHYKTLNVSLSLDEQRLSFMHRVFVYRK